MQYLIRYALAVPVAGDENGMLSLDNLQFALIVCSCLFIAAGGYIINDIEDVRIDQINKPERRIVEKHISENNAYTLYYLVSGAGLAIGFYLQYLDNIPYIGFINAISAGLLYFYATTYKCMAVIGNLIVSFLSALAVMIIPFTDTVIKNNGSALAFISGYAVFSFLLTLVRELIKDMEDKEGDGRTGCNTLAVVAGNKTVKGIAITVTMIIFLLLIWIQWISKQWETIIPFIYVLVFIGIPLLLLAVRIRNAESRSEFAKASRLTKFIMCTGILSILVFYLTFLYQ